MRRWVNLVLVASAAAVAAAQWLVPGSIEGLLGGLLLVLVVLAIFSQRSALQASLDAAHAAHLRQLESERRYRALFDAGSDAVLVYALEGERRPGQVVEVNEAACRSLGYSRAQLLAMSAEEVHAPEALRHVREQSHALLAPTPLVYETVHMTSRGERLLVEVSARLVQIDGRSLCLTVARSVAAHKELEGFLRGLTDRDELTGLLNRRGFFAQVERVRRRARVTHSQVLLLYLDVDGLKRVNDTMGHSAGDRLLVAVGDALRLAFRSDDVLARLGGDEFVALGPLGPREDERLDCQMIAERLEDAMRTKRAELGAGYDLSVSVGSVVASAEELDDVDDLLARTDRSMYSVKRARRRERDALEAMEKAI